METWAQRGDDMSKVVSFTFHLFNYQSTSVELFLGITLCWVLWGGGGKDCVIRKRKQTPFLASKNFCSNWDPQPPPPHPCRRSQLYLWQHLYKYLELSLFLEHNSGLIRCTFQLTKPCIICSISFHTLIALHGRNYCSLKFSIEKVRFKEVKLFNLWKRVSLHFHRRSFQSMALTCLSLMVWFPVWSQCWVSPSL